MPRKFTFFELDDTRKAAHRPEPDPSSMWIGAEYPRDMDNATSAS